MTRREHRKLRKAKRQIHSLMMEEDSVIFLDKSFNLVLHQKTSNLFFKISTKVFNLLIDDDIICKKSDDENIWVLKGDDHGN